MTYKIRAGDVFGCWTVLKDRQKPSDPVVAVCICGKETTGPLGVIKNSKQQACTHPARYPNFAHCQGPECTRPVEIKKLGLCQAHAWQQRRGKTLKTLGSPPIHLGGRSFSDIGSNASWRNLPEYKDLEKWHGTSGGYTNRKCRCVLCTIAWNSYCQGKRANRKISDPSAVELPENWKHGRVSSFAFGCRCGECESVGRISQQRYKDKYIGIEPGIDVEKELEKQKYRCKVCGTDIRQKHVRDHDHITGKFRGMLCNGCNTGIGKLGDSVAGLQIALTYLIENLRVDANAHALNLRGHTNMGDVTDMRNDSAPCLRHNVNVIKAELSLDGSLDARVHADMIPYVETVTARSLSAVSRVSRGTLCALAIRSTLWNTAAVVAHVLALGVVVLTLRPVPLIRVTVVMGASPVFRLDNKAVLVITG